MKQLELEFNKFEFKYSIVFPRILRLYVKYKHKGIFGDAIYYSFENTYSFFKNVINKLNHNKNNFTCINLIINHFSNFLKSDIDEFKEELIYFLITEELPKK